MDDRIPVAETYRGVGIHDQQDLQRIAQVKADIDTVHGLDDWQQLEKVCADVTIAPEARLLAAAKCEAIFQIAVDERRERPPIDLGFVKATVTGLNSIRWRSNTHYCSVLSPITPPGAPRPVRRAQPLVR